jgi:hypothetical protein
MKLLFTANGELNVKKMLQEPRLHPAKKALLLRLWETSGGDGMLSTNEINDAKDTVTEIKENALTNWTTIGVVSALFGITAVTMITAPLEQSFLYESDDFVSVETGRVLNTMYIACLAASACSAIVSIFISVIYTIVICNWIATPSDTVWFLVTFNLAMPGAFMGVSAIGFILALVFSFFICYSITTAAVAVGVSILFVATMVGLVLNVVKLAAARIGRAREAKLGIPDMESALSVQ